MGKQVCTPRITLTFRTFRFSPHVVVFVKVEQIGAHDVELRVELAVHAHDMIEKNGVEIFRELFRQEFSHLFEVCRTDDHREVTNTSHRLGVTW